MDFSLEVAHNTPTVLIGLSVLAISGLRMIERSRVFYAGLPLPFVLLGSGLLAYTTSYLLCMGAAYVQRRLQYRRAWNGLIDDLHSISRWGGWSKTAERTAILLAWLHFKTETEALGMDSSSDDDDDDADEQSDAHDAIDNDDADEQSDAHDAIDNDDADEQSDVHDDTGNSTSADEQHVVVDDDDGIDDDATDGVVAATSEDGTTDVAAGKDEDEHVSDIPAVVELDAGDGVQTLEQDESLTTSQFERNRNNPDASDLDI